MNGTTVFRWLVLAAFGMATAIVLYGWYATPDPAAVGPGGLPPVAAPAATATGSLDSAAAPQQVDVPASGGAALSPGERAAGSGNPVRGRVTDAVGRPVATASVWLTVGVRANAVRARRVAFPGHGEHERSQAVVGVVTDPAGEFEFRSVAKGSYTLFVEHPEHPAFVRDDLVVDGAVDGLVLVLEVGAEIRGTVVGVPAGTNGLVVALTAVESADEPRTVGPIAATGERTFPVSASGAFAIAGLRPGSAYRLHAAHEMRPATFRITSRAVVASAGTVGIVLEWDAGMRVSARLHAAGSGEPVTRGTVRYVCDGAAATSPSATATAEVRNGRLELGPFWPSPGETLGVEVAAPGFAPWGRGSIVLPANGDLDLGTIELEPVPCARVVVLAGDGKPVPDATVELRQGAPLVTTATARCGTDGSCALNVTPGTTVVFVARARAFARAELGPVTLPAAGNSSHEIRLLPNPGADASASARGTVRANGSPLAGARLVFDIDGAVRRPRASTTSADGSFRAERLPAGAAQLVLDHRDFAVEIRRPIELRAGDNVLDLDLVVLAVRGRVVDAAGKPVTGAKVRLLTPEGQRQRLVSARTDDLGAFTFLGVPTDAGLRLRIEAPGHVPVDEPIAAAAGERLFVL
ncbi:MAG: carboxypeptidase-like regulatory domain-containing protein, partial [Planctomycetota bacterium]